MAVSAHLDPVTDERAERRTLVLETSGTLPGGERANVLVHNASATGLLLETALELGDGETLAIDLPEAGPVAAEVVWRSGRLYGCRFEHPVGQAVLSAAQLRSAVGDFVPPFQAAGGTDDGFGPRLERLRKSKRMTLAQIADALGVSKPTVWAWEHGKAHPLEERLAPLAEALGVAPEELSPPTGSGNWDELVARHRVEIAGALGVAEDKVRIMIEL